MSNNENQEPDRVWTVSCNCGYSEKFRHKEDAQAVFEAHSSLKGNPACGAGSMKAEHAYAEGGVDPRKTLPGKGKLHDDFEQVVEP